MENIIRVTTLAIAMISTTALSAQTIDFDQPVQLLNLQQHQENFISNYTRFTQQNELVLEALGAEQLADLTDSQQDQTAFLRRAINMQDQIQKHVAAIADLIDENKMLIGKIQEDLTRLQGADKTEGAAEGVSKERRISIEQSMDRTDSEFAASFAQGGTATFDEEIIAEVLAIRENRKSMEVLRTTVTAAIGIVSPETNAEDARKFITYVGSYTNALNARKNELQLIARLLHTAFRQRKAGIISGLPDAKKPLYPPKTLPNLVRLIETIIDKQPEVEQSNQDIHNRLWQEQE